MYCADIILRIGSALAPFIVENNRNDIQKQAFIRNLVDRNSLHISLLSWTIGDAMQISSKERASRNRVYSLHNCDSSHISYSNEFHCYENHFIPGCMKAMNKMYTEFRHQKTEKNKNMHSDLLFYHNLLPYASFLQNIQNNIKQVPL